MAAKKTSKVRVLKKIGLNEVKFFKIANRKGYATICRNNLTEGRTVYQAYSRLVKAVKRAGYELPIRNAPDLPKPK